MLLFTFNYKTILKSNFTMVSYLKNIYENQNPVSLFGNDSVYPLLSTWISTWISTWTDPEALYE
jgi:hypothetical protein